MRFWFKMAGIGAFGYLMICLFPLPADYLALDQTESEFSQLAPSISAELSATGTISRTTLARVQQAEDRRTLAFEQWTRDLDRLGIG